MSRRSIMILTLIIIFPMLVSLACLGSIKEEVLDFVGEKVEDDFEDEEGEITLEEDIFEKPTMPSNTQPEEAPPTKELPTETLPAEEPTAKATETINEEDPQEIIMLDKSKWIQDDESVFMAYLFQNPNTNYYFQDSQFNFFLMDASGSEVGSEVYYIPTIYPGQTIAIVFTAYLEDDQTTVNSVSVDWDTPIKPAPDDMVSPFVINQSKYWDNDGYPMVTGAITNNSDMIYTDLRLSLVCYNSQGEIIGGSFAYIDFILAEKVFGFVSYVDVFDEVASIEVIPMMTYSTTLVNEPDLLSKISIVEENFYQGLYNWVNGGLIIRNETNTVIESSKFYGTFYDSSGTVVSVSADYIDYILPNDTYGFAPWVYSLPEDVTIASYDLWILPGQSSDNYELTSNPFLVDDIEIVGSSKDTAVVTFTNTYSKQVSEVNVFVLLRDAQGEIIGGGTDWTDEPTPAGGSTTVEVWFSMDSDQTIATVEAWVVPSFWTTFE